MKCKVLHNGSERPTEFGGAGWVLCAHWPDTCWRLRIAPLELPLSHDSPIVRSKIPTIYYLLELDPNRQQEA
jgi:hypothetical protein